MEDRFKQLSTDQLTQLITDAVAEYLNRREDVKDLYKQHAGGDAESLAEAVYFEGVLSGLLLEARRMQALMRGQDVRSSHRKRRALVKQIEEELRAIGLVAKS